MASGSPCEQFFAIVGDGAQTEKPFGRRAGARVTKWSSSSSASMSALKMFFLEPGYAVTLASVKDAESLSLLENEFIDDHRRWILSGLDSLPKSLI